MTGEQKQSRRTERSFIRRKKRFWLYLDAPP
jgi:hypothetical protein